ncbi:hypothetical protein RFI_10171 [Reticulomyxa filosa]|uniref:Uncharacterized protein n=1 Tax=Reticulomyxa filosa TaxID=46433 RepID=X6NMQ5_RETFI|nr:hypothetical protein RFI_10171 [Reticulomyxa filosa]|eukprot:ETO26964.1 hypothetical protein RFI_10171 [Reticulomyxa filosa]
MKQMEKKNGRGMSVSMPQSHINTSELPLPIHNGLENNSVNNSNDANNSQTEKSTKNRKISRRQTDDLRQNKKRPESNGLKTNTILHGMADPQHSRDIIHSNPSSVFPVSASASVSSISASSSSSSSSKDYKTPIVHVSKMVHLADGMKGFLLDNGDGVFAVPAQKRGGDFLVFFEYVFKTISLKTRYVYVYYIFLFFLFLFVWIYRIESQTQKSETKNTIESETEKEASSSLHLDITKAEECIKVTKEMENLQQSLKRKIQMLNEAISNLHSALEELDETQPSGFSFTYLYTYFYYCCNIP